MYSCESMIETSYHNSNERALKVKDICIICRDEGSNDFLYKFIEQQELNVTDGYVCYPISMDSLDRGRIWWRRKGKNETQSRKERVAKSSTGK